jgi:hypothetical protein
VRLLVRYGRIAGWLCLVWPWLCQAAYEPEKLGDSSRRWAINVGFVEYYNDNINTTTANPQSGYQSHGEITFRANVPSEQTFFRMNSTYGLTYSPSQASGKTEQSAAFDGLLSHTFTPRLVASISDTMRYALEPAVSDIINGQSIRLQQSGNYLENNTAALVSYDLSRRWTMSVRGGWDFWRYESSASATNNDRDVYSAGMNLAYGLTPRTFLGAGYSYSESDYVTPGSNDLRNSTSNFGYLTFSHAFNPRLSINFNGGVQLTSLGGGTQDTSPSGDMALNYAYSRDITMSLGFRYGITTTQVGEFRSSDTATVFGNLNYHLTPKLQAAASGLYTRSTFRNPAPFSFPPGTPIPKGQDTFQVSLSLTYVFNRWSSASFDYSHQETTSDFVSNSFTQNRVGLGVSLRY